MTSWETPLIDTGERVKTAFISGKESANGLSFLEPTATRKELQLEVPVSTFLH